MKGAYEAVELREGFYWVGAIDWEIRNFHGYSTHRGTTYNSYLLKSGRTVLFDTVKKPFMGVMLERIRSVMDPSGIDVIVSNHAELDHSGSLPEVSEIARPDVIYASRQGAGNIALQLDMNREVRTVGDGETVDIGGEDLRFIETRMLHWPDSMFSYLPARKILVSQDAFGMHLATPDLHAHLNSLPLLREEAARYYANILLPFSSLVTKLLSRVAELGLAPETIAPDHGPVWFAGTAAGPDFILPLYSSWAEQRPSREAVVAYDTMWHATEEMAHAIAEGLTRGGAVPSVHPLASSHRSDIAAALLEAGALFMGTPTINNNMFPTVADLSTYLRGLNRRNLVGAAFGSHGWSGEGVRHLSRTMGEMGVELLHDGLASRFRPTPADIEACVSLGLAAAARLVSGGG